MVGYIFGGKDTPWTYEELQNKRKMAEALAASNISTPRNVGEGLHAIGKALMYRKLDKKATAEEARLRDEFNAKWGSVLGGLGSGGGYGGGGSPSGTWTPEPPKPDAVQQLQGTMQGGMELPNQPKADLGGASGMGNAGLSFGSATMTPQEMLIAGAEARGFNPIDVATAISYETGGTFDPMIKGPTTQWGTHDGLIQFGDPQGEKYGLDLSSPDAAWRSQLDPTSGAVWKYLEDTGVQPGMGLPEIYSAINAGSVGRMGASDANNGGAPGTVADKVAGMGPHREKAAAFLGGTWTPNEGTVTASAMGGQPSMGMDIGSLIALASDPMASPAQKGIIEALIGQQMAAMDPMRAIEMEKAQLELAALKNPPEDTSEFDLRAAEAAQYGMTPGTPEYQEFVLTGSLPKAAEPGFAMLSADEVAALGLPPGVYQRGPDGRIDTVEKTQGVADPIADLRARALAAGLQEGTPEYQQFMLNNGKTPDGMVIESDGQGGFRVVQGSGAGAAAAKPFTEAQSKDVVFATRAQGALETLDPIAEALTSRGEVMADWIPLGLGGGMQSDEYQVAKTAGDEFLQAILRKDTGAAITSQEQALYGDTYLPRPGDNAARLAYKAEARRRAVAALEAGMSPAQIIAQERALGGAPDAAAPEAEPDVDGWTTLPSGVKIRVKQ